MTKELDMYGIYRGVYQGVMKLANYGLGYHMPEYIAGRGFISKLPQILKDKGAGKVLVVTDEGLIKAGAAGKVLDLLKEAGIEYELFGRRHKNGYELRQRDAVGRQAREDDRTDHRYREVSGHQSRGRRCRRQEDSGLPEDSRLQHNTGILLLKAAS